MHLQAFINHAVKALHTIQFVTHTNSSKNQGTTEMCLVLASKHIVSRSRLKWSAHNLNCNHTSLGSDNFDQFRNQIHAQ
jgi:hypothetical protein